MNEKETKFREWLDSKASEYYKKEINAVDSKEREYNASKWAYIYAIEEFDNVFGDK